MNESKDNVSVELSNDDLKAIRILLEEQKKNSDEKERKANEKEELQAQEEIKKNELKEQKKLDDAKQAVENERLAKEKNNKIVQDEKDEKEFRSNLIGSVKNLNDTYVSKSDGDTELLQSIDKKLDNLVLSSESQVDYQNDYGGYTIFATGLFMVVACIILPLVLGYVFIAKPTIKRISDNIFK